MFDFDLGDELELIAETAKSFAHEELLPRLRDHEVAREVSAEDRKRFAEIGLAGLELPEDLGGAGLGAVARAVVNEELAAGDPGAALALDPLGPALYPLLELGGEPALREFALPLIEVDGSRAVLVFAEDAELSVTDTVSGSVPWVPADRVDLLVVLERGGALVVREGIECEPLRGSGMRAAGASELRLAGAPIAARFEDPAAARRSLARSRLYLASLMVGAVSWSLKKW